jgi:hypothetical protein
VVYRIKEAFQIINKTYLAESWIKMIGEWGKAIKIHLSEEEQVFKSSPLQAKSNKFQD